MELVIVILLLGILSAVAIPRITDMINPSKETVTRHRMEELRKAIVGDPDAVVAGTYSARGFRGDNGSFPVALTDLVVQGAYANWNRYTRTGWNGPYVDSTGGQYLLDAWNTNLVYNAAAVPPTITSYGKDLAAGGGDDIVVQLRY